jgi:hypothetical protein
MQNGRTRQLKIFLRDMLLFVIIIIGMIVIEPDFVISDDVFIDNYKIIVYSFISVAILKLFLMTINHQIVKDKLSMYS